MQEIGLLGGTFDPVHNGHLQVACEVLGALGLHCVHLVPSAHPPHKPKAIVCDIEHRLKMLYLAVDGVDSVRISEIELLMNKPSYTYDTLAALKKRTGSNVIFRFILGHDAFIEIETWYKWKKVLNSTDFVVLIRKGFSVDRLTQILDRTGFAASPDSPSVWCNTRGNNKVQILEKNIADISSSDIRDRIDKGLPWSHLVPQSVASYIKRYGLYGCMERQ